MQGGIDMPKDPSTQQRVEVWFVSFDIVTTEHWRLGLGSFGRRLERSRRDVVHDFKGAEHWSGA
jgi:hypothetical protein